ncbi:autotransporter assembly complex protein TamA [Comamonas serinivorans]|nr:BamA/TamA family outer membrane protein [Comamonas serinivorans]
MAPTASAPQDAAPSTVQRETASAPARSERTSQASEPPSDAAAGSRGVAAADTVADAGSDDGTPREPGTTPRGQVGAAGDVPTVAAFTVEVRSEDKAVRELVDKHIELKRYAAVDDLDEVELQRLMALSEKDVRNLLGALGHFNPQVDIRASGPVAQHPTVVVTIEPGPRTRVADVRFDFQGDIATNPDADVAQQRQAITEDWSLHEGEAFSQSDWSSAKSDALRGLVAKRYPTGKISHSLADIDAPENAAHLQLTLDSGPLYRLGPITVKGQERYDPVLAERLSWLKPGEVYDQKRLVDAQQRLAASGYYNAAYIAIDPEGEPSAVPVTIQVREAKLQRLNLGVGFSTDSGPRLTLEHRHNKVPGIGWRAITKIHANRKTPLLESEWMSLPSSGGWRWAALGRIERIDDDSLVTSAVKLRYGRVKSEERYDRNIYVQYDRATVRLSSEARVNSSITANNLGDALIGDGAAISLNYAWTGRYFDNATNPRSGFGLGFDVGGGTTLLNGNKPFVRAQGRWLGLMPLRSSRLQFRTEVGAVMANDRAAIPASYLFRTGGDTSVRGYGFRRIGIPYEGDITLPGRYMAVASVEWLRPIFEDRFPGLLEHAVFVDVGGVANKAQDIRSNWGVGTGVRMNTPVGPLALDVAYGVESKAVRLHMSVGFVF